MTRTNRREFLAAAAGLAAGCGPAPQPPPAGPSGPGTPAVSPPPDAGPFRVRGYYTLMTRTPTAGLAVWTDCLDRMAEDRCNLLVHWIAGGFKSEKYPETWEHNADHENVKKDFTNELIAHAHGKGIKVVLGFTPYGYDGVNRYTRTHPGLTATGKDGKPTPEFGIYCWGRALCPAKKGSQEFMLGYTREMLDFYPDADGLFLESSDYSICHCPECGPKHFEQEFQFVKTISDEVWAKNPDATVIVYPHYFSGDENSTTEGTSRGAKLPFDPRYTLFFTPHSTKVNTALMKRAKDSLWWDPALIFHGPAAVREGARKARADGFTGYVPSLEAMSYVPTRPEQDGAKWLVGRRQVPFGFGWVPFDKSPFNELPLRVNRIAYREFCKNPDLSLADFEKLLAAEVFGADATAERLADLMSVHAALFRERDWYQPSPLAEPRRVKEWKENGQLKPEKAAEYRKAVEAVRAVAERCEGRPQAVGELGRIARWLADQWAGENAALLENTPKK